MSLSPENFPFESSSHATVIFPLVSTPNYVALKGRKLVVNSV
jgi:hypothetical protein